MLILQGFLNDFLIELFPLLQQNQIKLYRNKVFYAPTFKIRDKIRLISS